MTKPYNHLGLEERVQIQFLLERGFTVPAIARTLIRAASAASTVSRELARNGWAPKSEPRGRGRPLLAGGYRALPA